jgi:hypothetical protein
MDKKPDDVVSVPRWALEFIMENASLCDEGVSQEGWPSAKMRKAREAVEAALQCEAFVRELRSGWR